MTYVSVVTLVAYALVLALLAAIAVIDVRTRRVPNKLSAALAGLWLLWRVVLGCAGEYMGLGFLAEFLSPAPTVMVPPGLEIEGASLAGGILGAVILGGGLLVLTTLYEGLTHRESFGAGDIKLMTALGLFLGVERGLVCLLAACALSVLYALVIRLLRRCRCRAAHTGATDAPSAEGSLLRTEMPFAPFIALGTLVAFVS